MPSNTDDGIVVVARAICEGVGCRPDGPGPQSQGERIPFVWEIFIPAAKAVITAYESHLRDKGMVVVPRGDPPLAKRPVMWRVKDYADGWVVFHNENAANAEAERTGALMQGLYVRDGSASPVQSER